MQMQRGTCKWYNSEKGYGFLQPEGGGPDVFIHVSALRQAKLETLQEGQKVSFEVKLNERNGKTAAANVRIAA